eukprot:109570-Prorocentrum_lima.AAC.1
MTSSLVGSEMCIRDSFWWCCAVHHFDPGPMGIPDMFQPRLKETVEAKEPVSYTHLTLPTICSV